MTENTWCTACPECDFKKYSDLGALIGPIFKVKGSTCPECKASIRIKIASEGGPTAYAYAEVDHR